MILGHIGSAGVAKQSVFRGQNFIFLSLMALGPDILDKPARFLLRFPSRGLGHTLLAFLLILVLACLLAKPLKLGRATLLAGAVMWLSHLLADWLDPVNLFWPLLGPIPETPYVSLWDTILNFYVHWTSPIILVLDLAFCLAALYLWLGRKAEAREPKVSL